MTASFILYLGFLNTEFLIVNQLKYMWTFDILAKQTEHNFHPSTYAKLLA